MGLAAGRRRPAGRSDDGVGERGGMLGHRALEPKGSALLARSLPAHNVITCKRAGEGRQEYEGISILGEVQACATAAAESARQPAVPAGMQSRLAWFPCQYHVPSKAHRTAGRRRRR